MEAVRRPHRTRIAVRCLPQHVCGVVPGGADGVGCTVRVSKLERVYETGLARGPLARSQGQPAEHHASRGIDATH